LVSLGDRHCQRTGSSSPSFSSAELSWRQILLAILQHLWWWWWWWWRWLYVVMHPRILVYPSIWECIPICWGNPAYGNAFPYMTVRYPCVWGCIWLVELVSRGIRHSKMTGSATPSFGCVELPGRPILRVTGAILFIKSRRTIFR
jgi:hypothetical protein